MNTFDEDDTDIVPDSDEANITPTAIFTPALFVENVAEAPAGILKAMDSHNDGEQNSDSDFNISSMSPLRMTPIYERVMELKNRASRAPISSITEPESDTPIQLAGISQVHIYFFAHCPMSLIVVPFSGTNAAELQFPLLVFIPLPSKPWA
jgi:hypothetical protein